MTKNFERSWDDSLHSQPSRQLQLVQAGSSEFGIFVEEIAAIVDWREPTPLPGAAASILGVVCVQGRMLTVLDLAALPVGETDGNHRPSGTSRKIVALKGDEQLALAVNEIGETIPLPSENPITKAEDKSPVYGTVLHENKQIYILNSRALFPAAIQGRERRRRRF